MGGFERIALKYAHYHVKEIASGSLMSETRGMGKGGSGRENPEGGDS